jgi:hypothetical protein
MKIMPSYCYVWPSNARQRGGAFPLLLHERLSVQRRFPPVNTTESLERYNQLLAPSRERFEASPGLNAIRSNNDPRLLEAFLLYFCAIGAQMTEPVESWIRRAASRCAALGLSDLAEALTRHAEAEAGHHLMMIADLRSLVDYWNARHTPPVDADELLRQAPNYGASRYCLVHEENIAGNTPYASLDRRFFPA